MARGSGCSRLTTGGTTGARGGQFGGVRKKKTRQQKQAPSRTRVYNRVNTKNLTLVMSMLEKAEELTMRGSAAACTSIDAVMAAGGVTQAKLRQQEKDGSLEKGPGLKTWPVPAAPIKFETIKHYWSKPKDQEHRRYKQVIQTGEGIRAPGRPPLCPEAEKFMADVVSTMILRDEPLHHREIKKMARAVFIELGLQDVCGRPYTKDTNMDNWYKAWVQRSGSNGQAATGRMPASEGASGSRPAAPDVFDPTAAKERATLVSAAARRALEGLFNDPLAYRTQAGHSRRMTSSMSRRGALITDKDFGDRPADKELEEELENAIADAKEEVDDLKEKVKAATAAEKKALQSKHKAEKELKVSRNQRAEVEAADADLEASLRKANGDVA
mmetsp:Transcript_33809/g.84788  ORF Transcript_33809/g.84788 Transcript_33809/m.84788 type:complete len:385 (+) Transcript_33809:501-1655(+)